MHARTLRRVAKDEPSWLPVSCSGCSSTWYGLDRAHCCGCHRTFDSTELFDVHRDEDGCVSPAQVGLIKHPKSGIWQVRELRRRAS